jgi:hypothetical protein
MFGVVWWCLRISEDSDIKIDICIDVYTLGNPSTTHKHFPIAWLTASNKNHDFESIKKNQRFGVIW